MECKTANKQIIVVVSFLFLIFVLACSGSFLNVSLQDCLLFAFYQGAVVFGSGILLLNLLLAERRINPLQYLAVSFALGYAVVIISYFVTALIELSTENAKLVAAVMVLVLLFIKLATKRKIYVTSLRETDGLYILLFFVLVVIVFFSYSARYIVPDENHVSVYYNRDALYWIENATALKLSFPPQELRYSGIQLFYHYFASVYIAFSSMVTGIDTFSLGYALYPLTRCMILFGGVYFISCELIRKDAFRLVFMIALLFSTGIERNTQARYVSQLVYLPFGFDISMGYGAYGIALLNIQARNHKFTPVLCGCTILAFFLSIGHKAPVALVYMVFAGVICFYWLLKREYRLAFSYGIAIVLVFLIVMIVCIGFLQPVESRVNAGTFGINANLKNTWLYQWRDNYRFSNATDIKSKLLSILTEILALLAMFLSFNPLMIFLSICTVLFWIRKKCDHVDAVDVGLLLSFLFGIAMGSFNLQDGMSQMYYSLASYLPGLILGFRNLKFSRKPIQYVCLCVSSALLCFQVKLYFVDEGVLGEVKHNIQALISDELPMNKENDSEEFEYPINSIQYPEYEAMLWIKDNTPENSIIMPDKDVCKGQAGYMYYATFAERQAYLEGDCYLYNAYWEERNERRINISHIYLNDENALKKAKEDGVDYIIQTKWIIPTYEGKGCSLVYENSMVKIWQINNSENE